VSRFPLAALCAGALAVALAGCSSIRVNYDYDPKADFSNYHSWSWLPQPKPEVIDPRVHNEIVDRRVRRAVEAALAARGYQQVEPGRGDFGVAYHAAIQGKVSVQTINDYYGYGPVWGGMVHVPSTRTYVREYDEGTLILDVVDGQSHQIVWRASAQAEVSQSGTPEQRDRRVREAVDQMLDDFPPGGQAGPPQPTDVQ
jgi:hypothetical protein